MTFARLFSVDALPLLVALLVAVLATVAAIQSLRGSRRPRRHQDVDALARQERKARDRRVAFEGSVTQAPRDPEVDRWILQQRAAAEQQRQELASRGRRHLTALR